jgi:hypothetical protein
MSIDRRSLLLVAVVVALALQVWLLRGCFVMVGRSVWWQVALALVLGTVWVAVWLGSYSGFLRSLRRLLIGTLVFIVLSCAMLAAVLLAQIPVAVVCV